MNYTNKLKNINEQLINSETIRLKKELYGLFSTLILSKEYAKRNAELQSIMLIFGFEFKDYVYDSRTVLLSRVIRIIEGKSELENEKILDLLEKFLLEFENRDFNDESNTQKKEKKKKKNIFDDIFNQLG